LLKPPLVFLHVAMLIDDPVVTWPELGKVEEIDAEEVMKTYDVLGMPAWSNQVPSVVSLREGDEPSLYLLESEMTRHDALCISVRRRPGLYVGWWSRLEAAAKECGVGIAEHNRHDVLEVVALRLFKDGLRMLDDCVDLVRGVGIDPSPEAMRTEMALTKALQVLHASGFRAPRKR
jgi:hypothetical protein